MEILTDFLISNFAVTISILLLIFGLEVFFVNINDFFKNIYKLKKDIIDKLDVLSIISRRIFLNFLLNLIVVFFVSTTLIIFLQLMHEEIHSAPKHIVYIFIGLNIIILFIVYTIYEKLKLGNYLINCLNAIINYRFFRLIISKLIMSFYVLLIFIKYLISKINKRKYDFLVEIKNIHKVNLDNKIHFPNYFKNTSMNPTSRSQLEQIVTGLDSIVLLLTAIGLLITSNLFSDYVTSEHQFIFIIFFVSVIITKISANHERADAQSNEDEKPKKISI